MLLWIEGEIIIYIYELQVHTKDSLRSSCRSSFFNLSSLKFEICFIWFVACSYLFTTIGYKNFSMTSRWFIVEFSLSIFSLEIFSNTRTSDLFSVAMFSDYCSQNEAEDMCCHGNTSKWHTVPLVTVTGEKLNQVTLCPAGLAERSLAWSSWVFYEDHCQVLLLLLSLCGYPGSPGSSTC